MTSNNNVQKFPHIHIGNIEEESDFFQQLSSILGDTKMKQILQSIENNKPVSLENIKLLDKKISKLENENYNKKFLEELENFLISLFMATNRLLIQRTLDTTKASDKGNNQILLNGIQESLDTLGIIINFPIKEQLDFFTENGFAVSGLNDTYKLLIKDTDGYLYNPKKQQIIKDKNDNFFKVKEIIKYIALGYKNGNKIYYYNTKTEKGTSIEVPDDLTDYHIGLTNTSTLYIYGNLENGEKYTFPIGKSFKK